MSGAANFIQPALQTLGTAVGGMFGGPIGAAGGSALGNLGGGALGGLAGANTAPSSMVTPGMSGTPSMANMMGALPSFINPNDVSQASTAQAPTVDPSTSPSSLTGPPAGGPVAGMSSAGLPTQSPQWAGAGAMGQAYLNYVKQQHLTKLGQRTAYAAEHSTPTSAPPQLNLLPPTPTQVPGQY